MAFFAGIFAIYVVAQIHFEYLAEHQLFYNRIQHDFFHHFGPLLIAFAWPGTTLWRGMPIRLRRVFGHPVVVGTIRASQQTVLAPILFSGSFFLWLIPAVHFRAMIDPTLYSVMNWTMIAEGILFWCLVLDPQLSPPARISFAARGVLAFVVMFPQIIFGAIITFTSRDLICSMIYAGASIRNWDRMSIR